MTYKFIIVTKFIIRTAVESFDQLWENERTPQIPVKIKPCVQVAWNSWALRWKLWRDVGTHPYLSCLELICPSQKEFGQKLVELSAAGASAQVIRNENQWAVQWWQLQTLLPLRAGHQLGRKDPLRNLSQVRPQGVEGLHSQGENKCGAWLAGRDWGVCNHWCRGLGIVLSGFFPFSWNYLAAENKLKMMLCSLIRGCTPQQSFSIFYSNLRTKSSSYDIMFGEVQHIQNVPSLWFKR